MPPSAVGPVKAMIRSVDAKDLTEYVDALCESSEPSVRRLLEEYAKRRQVVL